MTKNKLYLKCKWYISEGLCKMPNCDLQPSRCISMEEIDQFCAWLIHFLDYEKDNDLEDVTFPTNFKVDIEPKQTDLNTLVNTIYEMLGY